MAEQRLSCASLWPGLCLVIGAALGWSQAGWVGLLVGSALGLGAGFVTILLLAWPLLWMTKKEASRRKPPVD